MLAQVKITLKPVLTDTQISQTYTEMMFAEFMCAREGGLPECG